MSAYQPYNQSGPEWSQEELRLSDAERERASQALGEHFAQGRLDADEHAERHERIWTAKTRGDIPPLFADLPGGSPLHPVPRRPGPPLAGQPWVAPARSRRPRRSGLPLPLKIALGLVAVVLVVTHWPLILVALGVIWLCSHKGSRRRRGYGYGSGGYAPGRVPGGCGPRGTVRA